MDRICYLVSNGSSHEGDPIWNPTVPVPNRSRVNRVDPYHKWIVSQTDLDISDLVQTYL